MIGYLYDTVVIASLVTPVVVFILQKVAVRNVLETVASLLNAEGLLGNVS